MLTNKYILPLFIVVYQSPLINEYIFLLNEKLARKPIVPVIIVNETEMSSMQLKYMIEAEKRVISV